MAGLSLNVYVVDLFIRRRLLHTFFYGKTDFSSQLGVRVANKILENEPESYLTVA